MNNNKTEFVGQKIQQWLREVQRTLLLLAAIAAISLPYSSCKKDWLQKKADKNQAVPTTLTDMQALMDNFIPLNYFTPCLGEVASDGHYVTESSWFGSNSAIAKNAYTWSNSGLYKLVSSWNDVYSRVFYSNLVLDHLADILPESSAERDDWDNIRGQALFHRAEAFFWLSLIYGQPYDPVTASTDQGISIRLNSDITEPSTRFSVQLAYDQILSDLKTAAELLPVSPKYVTRGSKPAVYGLLARSYMVMMNYDSMLFYSKKCLQLASDLIDYNTLSLTSDYIGGFNKEVIFHNQMYDESDGFITFYCLIEPDLYNLFSANDLRRQIFFKGNGTGEFYFSGNYNNDSYSLYSGISTDEVYLMRAEAYARKGNISAAMADLNSLLQTRWLVSTFVPFTATDANDALSQILLERRKELMFRGLRWIDLRRLNKDANFQITLTRTIGGQTYTLPPNNYRYTFPIPDDVLVISGLPQTTGW